MKFLKRAALALALALSLVGANVALSQPTPAHAATTCKEIKLNPGPLSVVRPWMTVPVCYNGSKIWQNGNTTAGVTTIGYTLNGISWQGTYNSGGSWLGAGLNYSVTAYGGWASWSCATRWLINANGQVYSYNRGC